MLFVHLFQAPNREKHYLFKVYTIFLNVSGHLNNVAQPNNFHTECSVLYEYVPEKCRL